jgi:alpha-tubulin suppressor-like RCC1 family protein
MLGSGGGGSLQTGCGGTSTAQDVPGLTAGVAVQCWGANESGELGDGTSNDSPVPVNVAGLTSGVVALGTLGGSQTCVVVSGGGVKCWGANAGWGSLGNGNNGGSLVPVDVSLGQSALAVAASGEQSVCALLASGGVKCWGGNSTGQLGNGTFTSSNVPVDVMGLSSGISDLAVGDYVACVLMTAGGAKCWGDNNFGELGNGGTDDSPTPVDVMGL